ncbi:MAG: PHP domain-containing protein [Holophagaceae bacterium]|nr:PHP domain-containing protein [Holophagaceae bacterium]
MLDLHCHSLFSDGTDSPEELVRMGVEAGLAALALTDHDTLDGLPRFLGQQPSVKTRLIPGIELSCRFLGRSLHVLGLFLDPQDATLRKRLVDLRQRREDRNLRMVGKLQSMGVSITWELVQAQAPTALVARPHFAKALVACGAASSPPDAFQRYVGDHAPGYVEREELETSEAIRWIWEAGGIPLVAHPGRFGRGFIWNEAMPKLQKQGMAGFEAFYGDYSPSEQIYFNALAARLGMARSGGSDYHGANKPGLKLGTGWGGLRVPAELLAELEIARDNGF